MQDFLKLQAWHRARGRCSLLVASAACTRNTPGFLTEHWQLTDRRMLSRMPETKTTD